MITDTSKYDRLNQQLKQHIYIYSIYIYTCNMIYIYKYLSSLWDVGFILCLINDFQN